MKNLFDTANLKNTYYLISPYPQNIMEKMAHGYWQKVDTTAINGSWMQSAGAIVSTSTNLAPLGNFHKEMILGVLHELNRDQQFINFIHKHVVLPDYCLKLKPAREFKFPKIG